MSFTISRRQILLATVGAASLALGAGAPAPSLAAPPLVTTEQFLALSKSLTAAADLAPGVAATLLQGFLATGHGATLAGLAAGGGEADPAAHDLANEIVAAWYSGLHDDGKGEAVAAFDGALLWHALAFTKPFASCGGETGYWADPPQG